MCLLIDMTSLDPAYNLLLLDILIIAEEIFDSILVIYAFHGWWLVLCCAAEFIS